MASTVYMAAVPLFPSTRPRLRLHLYQRFACIPRVQRIRSMACVDKTYIQRLPPTPANMMARDGALVLVHGELQVLSSLLRGLVEASTADPRPARLSIIS